SNGCRRVIRPPRRIDLFAPAPKASRLGPSMSLSSLRLHSSSGELNVESESNEELALRATEMHPPGVVALVIGGFGLAVLAIVVSSLREAAAMKCWPVAKGRVLSAKVEKYRQSVSRGTGGPRDRMTL